MNSRVQSAFVKNKKSLSESKNLNYSISNNVSQIFTRPPSAPDNKQGTNHNSLNAATTKLEKFLNQDHDTLNENRKENKL